jgi:hypothetical protein
MNACTVHLAAWLGTASLVAACNSGSAPTSASPVAFHLAAQGGGTGGAVELTSFRVVVGPAALGSGDQFGCVDCTGDESSPPPQLVSVPLDGSPVQFRTEQVTAGHYTAAEVEFQQPDPGLLAGAPGWPSSATVELAGGFNGVPFTLHLPLLGSFRETLNPAVDVSADSAPPPVAITVTLPVASWFVSNGAPLDPNDATQRAQIEQNAQSALQPPEPAGVGENSR